MRLLSVRSLMRACRAPVLLVALVGVLTVVSAHDPGLVSAFASSPLRVAHGRVWLLLTSGLLAERPLGPSILSFALLAALTFFVCGRRAFWLAGLLGHVLSTLLVYAVIALAQFVNSNDMSGVLRSHDYGVSAVSAAWLGAIAAAGWRTRGQTSAGRLTIVLSCLAVGLFAYTMRPGLTLLSSEHVVAFAIGIAVGAFSAQPDWSALRQLVGPIKRIATQTLAFRPLFMRVDPFVAVALLIVVVLVGGSVMSSALASLPESLSTNNRATPARCVAAWNRAQAGSALPWSTGTPAVLVAATRTTATHTPGRFELCTYLILRGRRPPLLVRARWQHGEIGAWRRTVVRGGEELPTNATLGGGALQLNDALRRDTR